MVIGVDTATSRWHAIGRAAWMSPPGYLPSQWQRKRGDAEENRQSLCESFDAFLKAAVALNGALGGKDEPVHLFVEHPLALTNPKTNIALGLAAGGLWGQHLRYDVFWWWVQIASWQKMVGVKSGIDKTPVIKAKSRAYAIEHLGLADDLDEDHYDAANIGLWGERELSKLPDSWRPETVTAIG
jgi:hypothetical protein